MNSSRRRVTLALLAGGAATIAPPLALGQQQQRVRVNYEYKLITPQPVQSGDGVEVIEFFWYGCPYCNALQPALETWIKRKPADVAFRRIPAIFRQSWVPHARVFFTLETLGELERLHQNVFRSYHVEGERLETTGTTAEWAARHGVDRGRWVSTFESADVTRKVEQAIGATRAYMIEGTPSLVVDGRFVTSTGMSETIAGVIPILDELVVMARQGRASR